MTTKQKDAKEADAIVREYVKRACNYKVKKIRVGFGATIPWRTYGSKKYYLEVEFAVDGDDPVHLQEMYDKLHSEIKQLVKNKIIQEK